MIHGSGQVFCSLVLVPGSWLFEMLTLQTNSQVSSLSPNEPPRLDAPIDTRYRTADYAQVSVCGEGGYAATEFSPTHPPTHPKESW